MNKTKVVKITNRKQFDCLVSCMAQNISLARNNIGNKDECRKIWINISEKLNSIGPPLKSTSEWQKVWTDLKLKVRKRIAANNTEFRATGGGANKLYEFNKLEEEIIRILQLDKVANAGGKTFGLEEEEEEAQPEDCETVGIGISSNCDCTPRSIIMKKTSSNVLTTNESDNYTNDNTNNHNNNSNDNNKENNNNSDKEKFNKCTPSVSKVMKASKKEPKDERLFAINQQTDFLKSISLKLDEGVRYLRKIHYSKEKELQLKEKELKLKEKELKLKEEKLKHKENKRLEKTKFEFELLNIKKRKLDLEELQVQKLNQ